jgi:hypothetical protein
MTGSKPDLPCDVMDVKPLPPCAPFPKPCSDRELALKFTNGMNTHGPGIKPDDPVLAFEARIRKERPGAR